MRTCEVDGRPLTGPASQRFCSDRCRKRAARRAPVRALPPALGQPPPLVEAVRADLRAAGAESSALGAAALLLADRVAGQTDTGAALAALARELRATMEQACRGLEGSSLAELRDELAARRAGR